MVLKQFPFFVLIILPNVISFSYDFCEIENEYCGKVWHIGCKEHDFTEFNDRSYKSLPLSTADQDTILNFFNGVRNRLAEKRNISNLRKLYWVPDYSHFAELSLEFNVNKSNVCYSREDPQFTQLELFLHQNENDTIEKSFQKSKSSIEQALGESVTSLVGCSRAVIQNRTTIKCIVNMFREDLRQPPRIGKPCSECKMWFDECDDSKYNKLCQSDSNYLAQTWLNHENVAEIQSREDKSSIIESDSIDFIKNLLDAIRRIYKNFDVFGFMFGMVFLILILIPTIIYLVYLLFRRYAIQPMQKKLAKRRRIRNEALKMARQIKLREKMEKEAAATEKLVQKMSKNRHPKENVNTKTLNRKGEVVISPTKNKPESDIVVQRDNMGRKSNPLLMTETLETIRRLNPAPPIPVIFDSSTFHNIDVAPTQYLGENVEELEESAVMYAIPTHNMKNDGNSAPHHIYLNLD